MTNFLRSKIGRDEYLGIQKIFEEKKFKALNGEQAERLCHQLQKKIKAKEMPDMKEKLKEYEIELAKE